MIDQYLILGCFILLIVGAGLRFLYWQARDVNRDIKGITEDLNGLVDSLDRD